MSSSQYQLLPPIGWSRDEVGSGEHEDASDEDVLRASTSTFAERRSLLLGAVVGLLIEGLSLVWHFFVVRERANTEGNSVETAVALILWSLITTAAPFIVLDHLRGRLLDSNDDLKTITQRLACMERRFGVGALLGVCLASAAIDAATGLKNHFRFSLIVAAATCLSCVVIPKLHRRFIVHGRDQMAYTTAEGRKKTMQCVDPETMQFVELTPGTLQLEDL